MTRRDRLTLLLYAALVLAVAAAFVAVACERPRVEAGTVKGKRHEPPHGWVVWVDSLAHGVGVTRVPVRMIDDADWVLEVTGTDAAGNIRDVEVWVDRRTWESVEIGDRVDLRGLAAEYDDRHEMVGRDEMPTSVWPRVDQRGEP